MQNANANANASARKAKMQELLEQYAVLLTECEQDTSYTIQADTLEHAKESLNTLLVYTDYPDELFSADVA